MAVVDEGRQIIVEAQAHGVGQEQELLAPMVEALKAQSLPETVLTTDSGYHSKDNVKALAAQEIEAFIPDNGYRKRDRRYAGQAKHRAKPEALWNKAPKAKSRDRFTVHDFRMAEDRSHAICPAGKRMYRNGAHCKIGGYGAMKFTGTQRDCGPCALRSRCLRHPQRTPVRQVAFFGSKLDPGADAPVEAMKAKIDSDLGKSMIARRFATVEPVFGNIRYNKGLDRFSVRGRAKVDAQWKLYCLVHNIEKLAKTGYGVEN